MSDKETFFGKSLDIKAAKQLGLPDSYTIFFATNEFEYLLDEYEGAIDEYAREAGTMYGDDAAGIVKKHLVPVVMPKGMMLIGMAESVDGPKVYGLFTFSEQPDSQE